jgi:hypothetical protein
MNATDADFAFNDVTCGDVAFNGNATDADAAFNGHATDAMLPLTTYYRCR